MNEKRCPICNSVMEAWQDTLDGWCLLEDYIGCPNHCYSYYYFTGTTEITIKGKVFSWYHSNKPAYKRRVEFIANTYLKVIRFFNRVPTA